MISLSRIVLLSLFLTFFATIAAQEKETDPADLTQPDDGASDSANTTESTSTESTGDTATSNTTSPLQTMYINTRKPALSSPMTIPVFSYGQLSPMFNSCSLEAPLNSSSCLMDDAYNDRLSFQITIHDGASEIKESMTARPPQLSTTTEDPNVLSFTVMYNCKTNADGIIPIHLLLHFGDDDQHDVSIYWQKTCFNGFNDKMNYGYLTGDEDADTAQQHSFGSDTAALLTVGASDESTEFFLRLEQPGALQAFQAPYITSTFSDIVSIHVRGNHPQGGIIEGLSTTKFQIGYECHRKGEATIETTVGIPPFKNISAVWKKDCGGNAVTSIQVGSEEDGFDIVDQGDPTPRYMVGIENIGTDHSSDHLHLPGNQSEWDFFIKNADDESNADEKDTALLIGRITATIENPSVLFPQSPVVMTRAAMSWRATEASSISLPASESLKVSMPLVCRAVGESRVLITVPVLGYKELEFGVAKECDHVGTAHRSSQFFFTVQNIFWFVATTVVIGSCVLLYLRRVRAKKGAAFTPLPTHEQN